MCAFEAEQNIAQLPCSKPFAVCLKSLFYIHTPYIDRWLPLISPPPPPSKSSSEL